MSDYLLQLKGLGKIFPVKTTGLFQKKQHLVALDQVNLDLKKGETLGLVGESGCGKTTLGRMICRLEDPSCGEIYFDKQPIHQLKGESLRSIRHRFQLVFQDPLNSLNPRINVRDTLIETLKLRQQEVAKERIEDLLTTVGLGPELLPRYAHQLSGGQRQRLGIARALAMDPALIVADEPVSSLDVSIQAQVLNLFMQLQQHYHQTMIFISHDLRVVNHLVDTVVVMYMGRIMEIAATKALFAQPTHPYTQALLAALPRLTPGRGRQRAILKGELPTPVDPSPGCRFYSRCRFRQEDCLNYENEMISIGDGHQVACCLWEQVSGQQHEV